MTVAEDDDGFVGYVPATTDPGPALLIAIIAIGIILVSVLPFLVLVGEKYEEQKMISKASDMEDEDDKMHKHPNGKSNEDADADSDESSVSSHGSFYSAVSGAMKEVLDGPARPASRSRSRHRRRRRSRRLLPDEPNDQYSMEIANAHPSDTASENSHDTRGEIKPRSPRDRSETGRGEGIRVSFDGSIYTESLIGPDLKVEGIEQCGQPRIDRNVCMSVGGFLDEIADIMAWDVETRRIIKLSIPFATQALFTGGLDTLTVGVIGKLIGTREVSAFVVTVLLVQVTTKFVGGFHEALATLCSQAIGANKHRLAGKYVQLAVIFYTVSYMPFAIMWGYVMGDAVRWFGFDEETVEIAEQYTYILLADYLLEGLSEAVHAIFDVGGMENFGTVISAMEELLAFLVILIWALVGSPTLMTVGFVQLGMGLLFFAITIAIVWWKGWFRKYQSGMIGSLALTDKKAVQMLCKTAASLSFGYLLTDGEWEVLTIFASFLGPAEVAAWGILGTIWDAINRLVDGIADASEVRSAFLLGSDQPERARLSAYKSMMIGVYTALFTTSIIYMFGNDLPTWLTSDPALQHILKDVLPMFGLGNAAMSFGSMCWALLGSQGRYQLATFITFLVSWFVTLPLSVIFSVHLRMSLEGQTAAVVLGYMVSAAAQSYFLFRSQWVALSETVMEDACSRESDDSLSKDVPTKAEDCEDSLISEQDFPNAKGVTSSSLQRPISQDQDPPRPSSSRDPVFQLISKHSLPSPFDGNDGPKLLYTLSGEWQGCNAQEEGVELEASYLT